MFQLGKKKKNMDNYYLTDEDIHGCEEDTTEMLLRDRLKKTEERIKELEEMIENEKNIYE